MKRPVLMLLGLALLWFFCANASCDSRRRREKLLESYELLRFRLSECREMGAELLAPEELARASHLSAQIEASLGGESWSGARRAVGTLQQTVARLLGRLKAWDADGDGLSNYAEFMLYGTSWNSADSDGDGYLDGSEILLYETDPLDSCAVPLNVPPETVVVHRCPALEQLRPGAQGRLERREKK